LSRVRSTRRSSCPVLTAILTPRGRLRPARCVVVGENVALLHTGGDQRAQLQLGILARSTHSRVTKLPHQVILTRKVLGEPLLRRIMVRRIFKTSASPTVSSTRGPGRGPGQCLEKLLNSKTADSIASQSAGPGASPPCQSVSQAEYPDVGPSGIQLCCLVPDKFGCRIHALILYSSVR
jgi:hypothetical protein